MADWAPPTLFDEYQILRPIGRGGMGMVYLGHDLSLDRQVAIKFIDTRDPDHRKAARFRLEGRALARLAHPNVVAVHRVGEVDGRPYLVSEYIRGRSLEALEKPLPWLRVLPLAMGIARGLAAAHRRGVLHRDIKPSNVMLGEDEVVKLVDFGLAKFVETPLPVGATLSEAPEGPERQPMESLHTEGRMGTPLYMAPETLRGDPASRRSDLYSVGALLYELCAGRPPRPMGRLYDGQVTPLGQAVPSMEPHFAATVDRCLRPDPAQRFDTAEELLAALEPLSPEGRSLSIPKGNPYRGLRPFDAEHRDLYFGRDAEVRELVERLSAEPLLIVSGDSGVGKSSLCRAGVLPRVEEGGLGSPAHVYRLAPGRNPLRALAAALSGSLETPPEALEAWIRSDPEALARALRQQQVQRGPGRQVVFVDQLEELFTLATHEEASLFAEVLGGLVSAPATHLLATVRGDFITRLAALPRLGPEVGRSLYLLRPLPEERIRETITAPARLKGVAFESEALVESLLASTVQAPGGLPLLQFALAELWDGRDLARAVIPASLMARIGGVEGALTRHADEVLARLLPTQREAARRLLLRLVTAEGTRSLGLAEELGATTPEGRTALEALVEGRLLVAQELDGGTSYQLAHEALLHAWGTLRGWLEEDGERGVARRRLEDAAQEWRRLGARPEELWRARQLAEVAGVDSADLTTLAMEFLRRSRDAVRRARLVRWGTLVAAPVALGLVVGGAWWKVHADAQARTDALLEEGRALAARGDALAAGLEARQREVFARYDAEAHLPPGAPSGWTQAEEAWSATLSQAAAAEDAYREAARVLESALFVAPDRPEPRRRLAGLTLARLALAQQAHRREQAEDLEERLVGLDPEGTFRARLGAPARVRLVGLPAGATVTWQRFRARPEGLAPGEATAVASDEALLAPGSVLVTVTLPSGSTLRYPLLLRPGATVDLAVGANAVELMRAPPGMVLIPGGPFRFGSGDPEDLRSAMEGAPPLHEVTLPSFYIGRTEEPLGRWVEFLESLPARERARRTPRSEDDQGSIALRPDGRGRWRFAFSLAGQVVEAPWGGLLQFPGRADHASQDWRQLPVAGVSTEDALAYAAWLSRTWRVPGARPCTEWEWEKAGRGADGRTFVSGEGLEAGETNIDATHGRGDGRGPEEVGSRPGDTSVYGVKDLMGNVYEGVVSVRSGEPFTGRGSAWMYDRWTARLGNRQPLGPGTRSAGLGVRLCADVTPRP